MSQVVTELVIDSNTAGAADFSRAMAGAEDAANRGVAAATGFNVGVAALGAGALGAVAGIKSMIDYVVEANKGLADLQQMAQQTGLSLADFQAIKFAGNVSGLSDSQVNSGLEKSASLLADAAHNANSLSKEFDANGLSIKNANGQLITQNQLLNTAANLVSNAANPQDAIKIAQLLGFTKEWVPLLSQGAAAMQALAGEAEAAGAIIDDATIQKATEFDAEWRKASVSFATYMKAAASEVLPFIDDLIQRAATFVKGISADDVEKFANDQLKALSEPIGLPDSAAVKIEVTPEAKQLFDDFTEKLNDGLVKLQSLADNPILQKLFGMWQQAVPMALNPLGNAANILSEGRIPASPLTFQSVPVPFAEGGDPMNGSGSPKSSGPNSGDALMKAADASQDAAQDAADMHSKIFSNAVGSDVLDRAINSLQKHTAQTEADTAAVGLGAGALAEYKAEAALMTAAQQNGTVVTQAMADKFQDLAQDAGDAAAALAKAKVASEIKLGAGTAFLSADDAAIATKLKDIYPDVTTALNSAEAAQLRFNSAAKSTSSAIEGDLVTGLTDIADGTKKGVQGFNDLETAVVKTVDQMAIKIAVVQPLMAALQGAANSLGLGNLFTPATGALNANGSISGASGPTSVGGAPLIAFNHAGGIVGSEATFNRYVHPAYFDHAPRMHGGGIAGDEVPIIARRGEGVFTEGQMAALGGRSAPQVNVTLIETPNGGGGTTQKQNPNGGIDIEVAIAQITAKSAATPGAPLNRVLTDQLGSTQRLVSR